MPTSRRYRTRNLVPGLTEYQRAWFLDSELPEEAPEDSWWRIVTRHHVGSPEHEAALWVKNRDRLMTGWLADNPGKRPSRWWLYDGPDEQRRRLGGIGMPTHEALAYMATFRCGVPAMWITADEVAFYGAGKDQVPGRTLVPDVVRRPFRGVAIDPRDPPQYEAQGAYLKRLGLLLPGEERRLRPADFEPEIVLPPLDDIAVPGRVH